MILLAGVFDRAAGSLGESLPRLVGAIVLLLVGLLVARIVPRFVARALRAAGVDAFAERTGIHDVLDRVGLGRSLARAIARATRIAITVVVIAAAVSLLGLAALNASLNQAVLFLPRLFAALALLLIGIVAADFAGDRVDRLTGQMAISGPVAPVVRAAIIALFGLTALAQLGIPTEILTALVGITILAVVLTIALAFGLGGRDVARQISAGRYVGVSYELGQRISLVGARGEVIALEAAATVLRTDDGRTLRVPNHLLLESIVTVEELGDAGGPDVAAPPA